MREQLRACQRELTRHIRLQQELVLARDGLDRELTRFEVLRALGQRLIAATGRDEHYRVALAAIIDAFEFECAAAFAWDGGRGELVQVAAFSMPRLPERLVFDASALEVGRATLLPGTHPTLRAWRLGLREALLGPMYDQHGALEGVLMGARCDDLFDPIRPELAFAFSVLTQQVSVARALDRRSEDLGRVNARLLDAMTQLEGYRGRLEAENHYLRREVHAVHDSSGIIGSSPALRRVLEQIEKVAPSDASVLVTGESGTGKELVARAIHTASQRGDGPMVKLNCAALPAHLVESELFGHEKGAFTGASARRLGRFELAHGGTIFLDEIGEMSPATQAKVLRVLQERELERVGGSETIAVDVRVIAATHRDLSAEVEAGRFREDLYYRLQVFPIGLPPLRERSEDIGELAEHFLAVVARRSGRPGLRLSVASHRRLKGYAWPGNARELQNVIERAVIVSSGEVVEVESLTDAVAGEGGAATGRPSPSAPMLRTLREVEIEAIVAALDAADWVIGGRRGAAHLLDMPAATLRDRIRRYGLARR